MKSSLFSSLSFLVHLLKTYIGSILVAVNSFKELKGLYDDTAFYHNKSLNECRPHIYALAEKAYSSLIATGLNQAFIISGESGAGKTESMKFICRYMANLKNELNNVQTNVLNVNVVLEAFGNAKTVYNNNSSRFVRTSLPTELVLFCSFYSFSLIPFFLLCFLFFL